MENLESPHQVHWQAPEPLGDANFENLLVVFHCDKFIADFFLAQGVVPELLGSLSMINGRSEDIVKPKLTGKDVHHNANSRLVICRFGRAHGFIRGRVGDGGCSRLQRDSVENIYTTALDCDITKGLLGNLRMCRRPKWTRPRALSAALA